MEMLGVLAQCVFEFSEYRPYHYYYFYFPSYLVRETKEAGVRL